ncbi:MAG TPA: hypothetical protein DCZ91_06775 [Lachnospiraceae bacterium]|nr:hypothetical protein [Lachnospiraceae bacterium]
MTSDFSGGHMELLEAKERLSDFFPGNIALPVISIGTVCIRFTESGWRRLVFEGKVWYKICLL